MSDNTLVGMLQSISEGFSVASESTETLSPGSFSEISNLITRQKARQQNRAYQMKVLEAAQIFEKAVDHPYGHVILKEALKVSDFPTYFGDVLDRMVLARFSEWIPPFQTFMRQGTFRDLTRTSRKTQFRGGSEALGQVGELGPYPERGVESTQFEWRGAKYGADFRISWETLLADDLGGLRDLPGVLASAARVSEAQFAASLYVGTAGPHSTLFNGGNGNVVTGNPPLSITALKQAHTLMRKMTDPATGNPMANGPRYLVVPPALELTAMEILGATNVVYAPTGATTTPLQLPSINPIPSLGLTLVVDPYIPVIATSNEDTTWFLFADPNSGPLGPGLAAVEFDRLVGMSAPLLLQKRSDFTTIGGGADPRGPLDELDSVTYRVVHAFGGGQLFPQAAVASNGSGV
jgi:hypothetical protein